MNDYTDGYIDDETLKKFSKTSPELKHLSNITSELRDVRMWNKSIEGRLFDIDKELKDLNTLNATNYEQVKQIVQINNHLRDIKSLIVAILVFIVIALSIWIRR